MGLGKHARKVNNSFSLWVSTGVAPDAARGVTLDVRPNQIYLALLAHALLIRCGITDRLLAVA
jgi:hypothetical protein